MSQLELEREMALSGLKKYREALEEAQAKGQEDRTLYGQAVIAKSINEFQKKIEAYVEGQRGEYRKSVFYSYAGHLPSDLLALFTLSTVVACNSRNDSLTVMANRLGTRVEKEVRWDFQNVGNEGYHFNIMRTAVKMSTTQPGYRVAKYLESRDNVDLPKWTLEMKITTGLTLIGLLHEADLGFEIYKWCKPGKQHTAQFMRINDKGRPIAVQALGGVLESDDLWPMIEPPAPWTAQSVGGYLSNGVFPNHVGPFNVVRAEMRKNDFDSMPLVIEAINKVQQRAWILDPEVKRVFDWVYTNHPKKLLPEDTVGCETVVANHKAITDKLVGREFWIPHNLCWRGRMMAQPSFSFQGPDYCRGLMQFARKTKVGRNGHRWISLHMANSYGDDKISKEARHVWAENNLALVERVATDPTANFGDWIEADAPWQFLASCLEYWRWIQSGRSASFESGLPVGMDGSSNAIQHGSAFLRDPEGASWVNMTEKSEDDVPADLYRKVSDAVNEELNRRKDSDELARQWLEVGVTRKTVKRVVMTRGYAGSKFGASDMILEDVIRKLDKKPAWSDRTAAVYLGQLTHDKSMEVLTGLAGTMEFLQGAVSKESIEFIMPTGFVFRQDYKVKKVKEIDVRSLPQGRMRLKLRIDTPAICTRKMKAGISANFTHACDAAHLVMVINDFDGQLGLVHDSYSTVPGRCDDLYAAVRDQFVNLHNVKEHGMLEWFNEQYKTRELPEMGTYDVNEIKKAPYAFL